jgi:hypothetical protein
LSRHTVGVFSQTANLSRRTVGVFCQTAYLLRHTVGVCLSSFLHLQLNYTSSGWKVNIADFFVVRQPPAHSSGKSIRFFRCLPTASTFVLQVFRILSVSPPDRYFYLHIYAIANRLESQYKRFDFATTPGAVPSMIWYGFIPNLLCSLFMSQRDCANKSSCLIGRKLFVRNYLVVVTICLSLHLSLHNATIFLLSLHIVLQ